MLDVACGTGIVARTAADLVAPAAGSSGVDLNEAMLTVARRVRPDIEWRQGDAGTLPFGDDSFDVVLSPDGADVLPRPRQRAARDGPGRSPGGTVAVLVPGRLEHQAAFAPFVDIAARHAGAEARSLLSTYFVCGDLDELTALVESAGLQVTTARIEVGTYRAPSVDAFVTTEVESTPLVQRISRRRLPPDPRRRPSRPGAVHHCRRPSRSPI